MKILVNFNETERNMLPVLGYYIRQLGYTSVATSKTHTISDLISKAKGNNCDGIFLCNTNTLANCVPGTSPTLDLYRGSRLDYSIPIIVGNSLNQMNTVIHGKFILQKDLEKFKQLRVTITRDFVFQTLTTQDQFATAFEAMSRSLIIAYDIETVTLSPDGNIIEGNKEESDGSSGDEDEDNSDVIENGFTIITCASFSCLMDAGEIKTYVLPFWDFLECHWADPYSFENALTLLRDICALPVAKAMHNGLYDCVHSIVYGAWPRNFCLDTMGLAHAQYVSLPKSLDYVASLVLSDYYQWKPQAKEASKYKDINKYWEYNAKDTFYTLRIALHYLKEMPSYARKNYADQFKLVYPSLYCAFEGWKIDQGVRQTLKQEREELVTKQLEELQIMLDDKGDIHGKGKAKGGFNPASHVQIQHYIYDVLGAKDPHIGFKKDKGKRQRIVRGTDSKNLAAVSEQHPILAMVASRITDYRKNTKAIGTYFNFIQKQGRLLYHLDPFGTETERMASKKSSFWCGTQVQNIPQYAKKMLIADGGYTLCEPDNSQSEARCTAYLAGDLNLIEALETEGKDFYISLGTLFFGIPYEQVTKDFRNKVLKKIVHGTNYMMKEQTFIENAGVDNILFAAGVLGVIITATPNKLVPKEMTLLAFAHLLLEKYHEPFYRIRQWYQEVKHEISTTHMLRSPLGHVRYFFGDPTKHYPTFASAVAHGPQNLSVSIVNTGWWKQWLLQKKEPIAFRMKAQIHDSAPFQYLTNRTDIRDRAIECFRNPVVVHGRTLKIPVDYKYGPNWGEMISSKG